MKRALLLFIFLILSSTLVFAQSNNTSSSDINDAFNWLIAQADNDGSYDDDIMTTAFAALALKQAGALTYADDAFDWIKSEQDDNNNCWPDNSCKIKDTAFALLVYDEFGEETEDIEEWLTDHMSAALTGNWWLEVITSNTGNCEVSYEKRNGNQEQRNVQVDAGEFPSCPGPQPDTLFNLNNCLEGNLLNNNPGIVLDVDCDDLGPSTIISVVYNTGSNYYLIKEAGTSRDLITIENGCFPTGSSGSCNKGSTLYTNWILSTVNAETSTLLWLKTIYDDLDPLDNALLTLATQGTTQDMFVEDLEDIQKNNGSFDNNELETALAILALRTAGKFDAIDEATDWLRDEQDSDGSWDGNELKTAAVLYAAFSSSSFSSISGPGGVIGGGGGPGTTPGTGSSTCNSDGICDPTETDISCPADCTQTSSSCVVNGECEAEFFGENSQNCPADCSCGDNVCDDVEQAQGTCPADCPDSGSTPGTGGVCGNDVVEGFEECDGTDDTACSGQCQFDCTCPLEEEGGSSVLKWILLIVVILIVLGLGYYGYIQTKGGSKKKKGPLNRFPGFGDIPSMGKPMPPQTMRGMEPPPRRGRGSKKTSKVEDELDKSLKEAKKLLKKV